MQPGRTGGLDGLTAAVDTTAGAVHDFDEVIAVLVDADAVEDLLETLIGAIDDTDTHVEGLSAECLDGHRDRSLDNGVIVAADDFDVGVLELFTGKGEVGRTKRRFHHAAGNTKDRAGTRIDLKRTAFARLGHFERVDAFASHQFGNVACRERGVDVLEGGRVLRKLFVGNKITPSRVHFGAASFENFGRTRRYRHKVDLAGIALEDVLGGPRLRERTAHLQRRLGRREVRKHVGMVRFGVFHPCRAATGKVRERMLALFVDLRATFAEDPILDLLDEFCAFFNDRLVGRAIAVVDDEAELFKGVDHLFGREFASLATEFFAKRNTDGGRGVCDADTVLRIEDAFNFIHKAHLLDGVKRAGNETLAAVNARVVDDFVFGTETALDGVRRAELAAGIATDAVFLVDVDDPAKLTLAEVADVGGTFFAVSVGARSEGMNRDRFLGHGRLSKLDDKPRTGMTCLVFIKTPPETAAEHVPRGRRKPGGAV